ncbi:MAG: hypothetical protein ACXU86_08575 [Archangium sp.]
MMRPSAVLNHWVLALAVVLSTGCKQEPARPTATDTGPRPTTSVVGPLHLAGAVGLDEARRTLVLALKKASAFHSDRLVAHLSHVCSLEIEGKRYPVIDLQELIRGETTPRGVNAILVLDPNLSLVQRIEYTTERPLFCAANRLYVWGDLRIDELSAEGNELTFDNEGHVSSLREVEANEVPAWPVTGDAIR